MKPAPKRRGCMKKQSRKDVIDNGVEMFVVHSFFENDKGKRGFRKLVYT